MGQNVLPRTLQPSPGSSNGQATVGGRNWYYYDGNLANLGFSDVNPGDATFNDGMVAIEFGSGLVGGEVPEPGTHLLLALGAAGIALSRRRRRAVA